MFFKKLTIPLFVFITGACVLIIEIIAIRFLSPYFGNTIFTVSSVISVVLAALSLGYYFGGRLADKYPNEKLFYGIIALSGFVVIFLHVFGNIFLSTFGYSLSIIYGPIISSAILFFLQSFLLGMLSPFAVKLQTMRLKEMGVGSVSGQIFFWSTLGSILGSLSAGFILIPNFGISKIILGIGFLLIVLGLFGDLKNRFWPKLLLIIFLLFLTPFFLNSFSSNSQNIIYSKDSVYQKITIYDGIYNEKPARFLTQDRNSSAAEFIGSEDLVFEYTKYYALYQITNPNIKEALTIGGGAYSVPKAILKDLPEVRVDVAEIDPLIFYLGKKYFGVPSNTRLNNFSQDGRRMLYDSNKRYDVIFSDAYSSLYSTPQHLTTQEFFKIAKERLSNNGIFIANVIGSLNVNKQSFALSEIKTFKSIFPNSYFFAVNSPESQKPQNIIFVGYNGNNKIDFDNPEIKKNKNYIISGLSNKKINISKFDFSSYPILTDDFAPVDYLMSKEFKNL